ncbi:uncharacterized protein G2W53_003850 [Senna tora]|uniref:Uncharacterized protein n=1 Tax=Senna tora TaxID=362788 RepID=A0A834XBT3_9FABA|nr:uncharacterized protein G2W53_003850 [Senna tora]
MDTFGNPSTNIDIDSEVTNVNAAGHVVNNHDTQANNDEEEEGLELNNASVFFIKNETKEKMKPTLYSTSTATTEADWKGNEQVELRFVGENDQDVATVFKSPQPHSNTHGSSTFIIQL